MKMSNDFVERRIIEAVRLLLAWRVNGILKDAEFVIPVIEFEITAGVRLLRLLLSFLVVNGQKRNGFFVWTLIL